VATSYVPVLSHFQAATLLQAKKDGKTFAVSSLDLGISSCTLGINDTGAILPDRTILSWPTIAEISATISSCFYINNNSAVPIKNYSDFTGRSFSLMPTITAPAMIIAGFPMHRIKDTDPLRAAQAMIATIAPVRGQVLDTATGLGYTAIACAKSGDHVTTVEFDSVAQEVARLNPWSRDLFDNPKITRIIGDAVEEIEKFPDSRFDRIVHDPPAMSLAGDLYSGAFYNQLYRVLKPGGRAFHYIGDPGSRSGARTTKGVIRRLGEAGFGKVAGAPDAFGVAVYK
jgi:uncharacterized protein